MINKEINLLDKISEYYSTGIRANLTQKEDEIKKIFDELIHQNASQFNLVSENSIQISKYVFVNSRVKEKDSFREKLIRKNLGLQIIEKLSLTETNFNDKKTGISKLIEGFDDIIGLRLVCDLNKDCPNVLRMIKNNISYLEDKKIVFLEGEMNSQPQKMKNGLNIYRLKGIFDNKYGVELQIKSKIDQAWGDLDHFIFYKDYSFFPTKSTVQQTMNNVGKLLDEIESLLYNLRNSKDSYNKNLKKSVFLENIEKAFSDQIKEILGFSYQLEKISGIIEYFIISKNYDISNLDDTNLKFDFLNYDKLDKYNMYLGSRELSFELQILEAIYQIIWEKKQAESLDADNYNNFLDSFNCLLKSYIVDIVNQEETLLDYSISQLDSDMFFLTKYNVDERVWISVKNYTEFFSIYPKVDDMIKDIFEDDLEDGVIVQKEIEFVKHILMCAHFEADVKKSLENKMDNTQKIFFELKERLNEKYSRHSEFKQLSVNIDKISNSF
ncbi:MAG: hypothetical protein JEY96_14890 [Bacteroidales bacterium]|nr:hypothetical protein [Bacteroidales bacterium]